MVSVTCRPSLNPNAVLDDIGTSMIEEESMVQNGKLQVPIRKGRSLILHLKRKGHWKSLKMITLSFDFRLVTVQPTSNEQCLAQFPDDQKTTEASVEDKYVKTSHRLTEKMT